MNRLCVGWFLALAITMQAPLGFAQGTPPGDSPTEAPPGRRVVIVDVEPGAGPSGSGEGDFGISFNVDGNMVVSIGGSLSVFIPDDADWDFDEDTRRFTGNVPNPLPATFTFEDVSVSVEATVTVGAGTPGGSAGVGGTTTCTVRDRVPSDCVHDHVDVELVLPTNPLTGEPITRGLPVVLNNWPQICTRSAGEGAQLCDEMEIYPQLPSLPPPPSGPSGPRTWGEWFSGFLPTPDEMEIVNRVIM